MTPIAQTLYDTLLAHHQQVCRPLKTVSDQTVKASLIPYGELRRKAHLSYPERSFGTPLSEIHKWCSAHDFPPINALVVRKDTREPGETYPSRHWKKEVRECVEFKGYPNS